MFQRFAIYYAPARGSALDNRAEAWLARPELAAQTISARRYGFHATIKAPMRLSATRARLEAALADFARAHAPVAMGELAPRLLDGFLALTTEPQPRALTDFATEVVEAFEPFRAPLSDADRARRLAAPLTARQRELVDRYGYPYVLEEFQLHMTLSDRLPDTRRAPLLGEARAWFAEALAASMQLDRLVLFAEPAEGGDFVRLDDFVLGGAS